MTKAQNKKTALALEKLAKKVMNGDVTVNGLAWELQEIYSISVSIKNPYWDSKSMFWLDSAELAYINKLSKKAPADVGPIGGGEIGVVFTPTSMGTCVDLLIGKKKFPVTSLEDIF